MALACNMGTQDVNYKDGSSAQNWGKRLQSAAMDTPHLLLKGGHHVQHLPSLFSELRVNFSAHKEKKKWQHIKTSRTLKLPSPKPQVLTANWAQFNLFIQLKGYRLANNQTWRFIGCLMINIRLDTRGTKMSNGKAEKSPQVQVRIRAVWGKRKFPKHLHTHSGLLLPQSHQVKVNPPKPVSE